MSAYEKAEVDLSRDENQLFLELRELSGKAADELKRFQRFFLLRIFKFLPLWMRAGGTGNSAAPVPAPVSRLTSATGLEAGGVFVASVAVILALRHVAQRQAEPLASSISKSLAKARRLHDACFEKSEAHCKQELERIKNEYATTVRWWTRN